nr:hypothetical protein [Rhizobium lusitanum]
MQHFHEGIGPLIAKGSQKAALAVPDLVGHRIEKSKSIFRHGETSGSFVGGIDFSQDQPLRFKSLDTFGDGGSVQGGTLHQPRLIHAWLMRNQGQGTPLRRREVEALGFLQKDADRDLIASTNEECGEIQYFFERQHKNAGPLFPVTSVPTA